jgi:hypothetical protein
MASTDVYNNTITGYLTSYTGYQHQDGAQSLGSSYLRIYNNKFVNMSGYAVYLTAYYGDFSHVKIYNNEAILTSSGIQGVQPQGLLVGQNQPGYDHLGRYAVFTDIILANNTVADYEL